MLLAMIESDSVTVFASLSQKMKAFEQRKYINAIISVLAKDYLNTIGEHTELALSESSPVLAGVTTLISKLCRDNDTLKEHLVTSLTKSGITALDDSLATRRSVIAVIAKGEGRTATHDRMDGIH